MPVEKTSSKFLVVITSRSLHVNFELPWFYSQLSLKYIYLVQITLSWVLSQYCKKFTDRAYQPPSFCTGSKIEREKNIWLDVCQLGSASFREISTRVPSVQKTCVCQAVTPRQFSHIFVSFVKSRLVKSCQYTKSGQ